MEETWVKDPEVGPVLGNEVKTYLSELQWCNIEMEIRPLELFKYPSVRSGSVQAAEVDLSLTVVPVGSKGKKVWASYKRVFFLFLNFIVECLVYYERVLPVCTQETNYQFILPTSPPPTYQQQQGSFVVPRRTAELLG